MQFTFVMVICYGKTHRVQINFIDMIYSTVEIDTYYIASVLRIKSA
ncbi:hypothetical protein [Legionella steelei]|nr:hypothetical protein [Legionella steelei]